MDAAELTQNVLMYFVLPLWLAAFIDAVESEEITVTVSHDEAERRAWATVNKETHGGKKSGSGRGKPEDHNPSRKGGRLGGRAAARRTPTERSRSARRQRERESDI